MRNIICLFLAVSVLCFLPTTTAEAQLFYPSGEFGVGSYPVSVAIGDLNDDSILDLVTVNDVGNDVSVLLGNGDGTFQVDVTYGVGDMPWSVGIGDLDGDGDSDLAVTNVGFYGDNVSVLLGNGDGTFQTAMNFEVGDGPLSVAIADLDDDGNLDLAVTNISDNVSILLGNGDGTFQNPVYYGAGEEPLSVAIDDLDGDSDPDLVTANGNGDNVSVLLGNGDGTFQTAFNYGAGDRPYSVGIGDLNGDDNPDLAVTNYYDDNVSVLLGNGDGTFQADVTYGVGDNPWSVAIGDLDGDGDSDLAVTNIVVDDDDNILVLPGNGDGTFQAAVKYEVDQGPLSVAIGDLDGDNNLDLVTANGNSNNVSVLINSGVSEVVSAEMTCVPSEGTLPFNTHFNVTLTNEYTGFARVIDARISLALAGGQFLPNWKRGRVTLSAGDSMIIGFNQMMPAMAPVVGANTFSLIAEDTTPSPYNQPPYPPSGDTDTANCTVTGIAP